MAAVRTKGHEACTGCGLCQLACPVWHATHDVRLTPHGRAKALQHGATVADLAESIDSCTFCGACEPACPEDIALIDMIADLRLRLAREQPDRLVADADPVKRASVYPRAAPGKVQFLPDDWLRQSGALLGAVAGLWPEGRLVLATDNGEDIALALETGGEISDDRLEQFLASLRQAAQLVVCDGLLIRYLRRWLPDLRIDSLGLALTRFPAVTGRLGAGDFYVIEARAYHADRERLVGHYDALRQRTGCDMNLDLQRLALSTTADCPATVSGHSRVDPLAQARWMLEGRDISRIIVEDLHDVGVFSAVADVPVLHVAELAAA